MESSDDEKDHVNEKSTGNESTPISANGTKFVDEVLNGSNERFLENFRMEKHVFYKLCDKLKAKGLLRHTSRIKVEEQLAIFLFIIGHNLRTRAVQELFRYSGETISRHFNNVLNAIIAVSLDFFQPPGSEIPPEIRDDPRFYPYFMDCVGAVNGTHFPVIVGVDEQGPFRNKNGVLSQSVLAACSFNMKFHYVLAGWEGSAPDIKVLNSALTRKNNLKVPEGRKYFLVDFKYANIPGFIAPYIGAPYRIIENENGLQPQDAKELFNHRHSLLRSITDRAFGSLKERFPILMSTPSYPLPTQVKLVVAACALHNYIRDETPDDIIFKPFEHENCVLQLEEPVVQPIDFEKPVMMMMHADNQMMDVDVPFDAQQIEQSSQLRDAIATEIWNDYIHDFPVTEV
ncbi:putative harbinger transposase-derived nuclease domain-containing protein [Helianthus annuus]|uniref:Harbinger transposase-derived nuclease domain-containing protein n=1 Tax=Helianthus annuus TaxID=4232 RepID=A0A9K3P0J3_HELAN|nr:putative harbinger transposase-derived nuclease domain-containing protein [Helianthus annuus]KAJ0620263.1 putative harbinger transposase-derived nuclease domain-containing protein [Helianthus annuus]